MIEVQRRTIAVVTEQDVETFPMVKDGEEVIGPRGWLLRRRGDALELDTTDGLVRRFEGVASRRATLASIRDRNDNAIVLESANGLVRKVIDGAGRSVVFEWSSEGQLLSLTATLPKENHRRVTLVRYRYDAVGNLVTVIDAVGHHASFTYDDDHRLTSQTNRAGVTFHYRYDEAGRCVETWGDTSQGADPSLVRPKTLADERTTTKGAYHYRFDYGDDGYAEVVGAAGMERFTGKPGGRIDQSTHGAAVVSRTYDAGGHLASFTDGMGATTTFERDARGRLLVATDPLGRATFATRDSFGDVVEVIDPEGGVSTTTYDNRGNVLTHREPDGALTSYTWDERGLMTSCTEPDGTVSTMSYDEEGNWVSFTAPDGGVWRRSFDGLGRKVQEEDPNGALTTFSYDDRGDLLSKRDPTGRVTTFTYDGERKVTSETEPGGVCFRYEYGALGELTAIRQPNETAITFRYSIDGHLVEVINELGASYRFAWDPRGNMIEEVLFDGSKLRYEYDLCDRLVATIHPDGRRYDLEYDAVGQLVRRVFPSGDFEEYDYDLLGEVVSATNSDTQCRFRRDAMGRIVAEEQVVLGARAAVEVEHSPIGEIVRRQSSLGHLEEITPHPLGGPGRRDVQRQTLVAHVVDRLEQERERSLPGGGSIVADYDGAGRLLRRTVRDRQARQTRERSFEYDDNGSITRIADSARGDTRLRYDEMSWLVEVASDADATAVYSWDGAANLFEPTDPRAQRSYGRNGELQRRGDTTYEYDADGCRVAMITRHADGREEATRYEWTDSRRLAAVVLPSGRRIEMVYDCYGRRLAKRTMEVIDGVLHESLVRFVWEGDDVLHEIHTAADGSEERVRTYLWDEEAWHPLAHRDGAPGEAAADEWLHYFNDPAGTPVALVNAAGAVVADLRRDPFGRTDDAATSAVGLPGQYVDEETGLAYQRFRFFDPVAAQFISRDPTLIDGDAVMYGYPPNPWRWIDPLGLARFPDSVKAAALQASRDANGGKVKCAECGITCVKPKKSMKGETAAKRKSMLREWQLDHIHPDSKGGANTLDNCQVLCRRCNRKKSNKV
ncbi:MAG: HNH endonuclease [Myxococcales bacterium]|nr:HNH endonuclease [Myxococcales bacterium]